MSEKILSVLFGHQYECSHPSGEHVTFRARSLPHAYRKLKGWLITEIYGDWALTYNATQINKILKQFSVNRIAPSAQ